MYDFLKYLVAEGNDKHVSRAGSEGFWGSGKSEVGGRRGGSSCRPLNGMLKNLDITLNRKIRC